MKRFIVFMAVLVLICSGVLVINIRINVNSFDEAKDKVIDAID